jgi:hypothetical protein
MAGKMMLEVREAHPADGVVDEATMSAGELLEIIRQHLPLQWQNGCPVAQFWGFASTRQFSVTPVWSEELNLEARMSAPAIAKLFHEENVRAYSFTLESWYSPVPKACRPTDDPDRKEGLMVGAVDATGGRAFGCFEIKRDYAGGGHLTNWEMTSCRGWVWSGWPFELLSLSAAENSLIV